MKTIAEYPDFSGNSFNVGARLNLLLQYQQNNWTFALRPYVGWNYQRMLDFGLKASVGYKF